MDNMATEEENDQSTIELANEKSKYSTVSIPEIICEDEEVNVEVNSQVNIEVNGDLKTEVNGKINGYKYEKDIDANGDNCEVIVQDEKPLPDPPQNKSLCYRIFCCCCKKTVEEKEPEEEVEKEKEDALPLPSGKISIVEGADDPQHLCARGRRIGLSERNRADRDIVVEKLHDLVIEDNKQDFGF